MKKSDKDSFLDVLEMFTESYLPLEKGSSKRTIKSYKTTYGLLVDYLYDEKNIPSSNISFDLLDYTTLTSFLQWLQDNRKVSASTRNQRLAALNSFASYAQNVCLEAAFFKNALKKIPMKKAERKIQSTFTVEETQLLLNAPNDNYDIGKRDKVLLSTMYGTGARCSETCNLKVKNFRFKKEGGANVDIIRGKGKKSRTIYISEPCAKLIKDYIRYRKIANQPETFLFKSQTHDHMSVSAIEAVYKKYIDALKKQYPEKFPYDDYTPHTMRRTVASHMLEAGIDMEVIRTFLGHSSIFTTEIYATLSQKKVDEELKNWAEKWFPQIEEVIVEESNRPSFLR
ncbi:tyrosine-type recombinase/integrase [Methanobrevibacter sp.]|uniref:tyrosine-type recombinase/integrase n=1 Tax=Methanobrevibacter sp. TaxID=66852 RepID=UPI00386874E9